MAEKERGADGTVSVGNVGIRQVDKPCPVCGSMYKRNGKCNVCEGKKNELS
jgi:hypothetical protein